MHWQIIDSPDQPTPAQIKRKAELPCICKAVLCAPDVISKNSVNEVFKAVGIFGTEHISPEIAEKNTMVPHIDNVLVTASDIALPRDGRGKLFFIFICGEQQLVFILDFTMTDNIRPDIVDDIRHITYSIIPSL